MNQWGRGRWLPDSKDNKCLQSRSLSTACVAQADFPGSERRRPWLVELRCAGTFCQMQQSQGARRTTRTCCTPPLSSLASSFWPFGVTPMPRRGRHILRVCAKTILLKLKMVFRIVSGGHRPSITIPGQHLASAPLAPMYKPHTAASFRQHCRPTRRNSYVCDRRKRHELNRTVISDPYKPFRTRYET